MFSGEVIINRKQMKNVLLILLLLIYNSLYSQYSFEYTIASDEDELIFSSIEDNKHNIILVGRIGDRVQTLYDAYIIKIFPNGDTLSRRIHRADTNCNFRTIELLDDGNYFITGNFGLNNSFHYDHLWICKMDTSLNILFEKSYKVIY